MTREPEVSTPPPLPPGRVLYVPDRGEVFFREQPGPDDALPVLLLHGWTATADVTWFSVYQALEGRHRVIAADHRGHGRGIRAEHPFTLEACADDAAGLLEALEIERAIVAGYSLGGAVALLIWQRHPDRVAGLVLAATALEWRSTVREKLLWRTMSVLDWGLRMGTGDGFVQRYLREAVEESPDAADLRAWVSGELKRGFCRDVAEAGRVLAEFDASSLCESLDVPCATVVTTDDYLVRPEKQYQLAEATRSEVFEIAGNHDAPLVRAKEFAGVMEDAVTAVARAAGQAEPEPAHRPVQTEPDPSVHP